MLKKLTTGLLLACAMTASATLPAAAQAYIGVGVHIGPPPAPIYERVPPAPGRGYAWRAGYWHWNGGRYVWIHGYYGRAPYATAHWVPEHYVRGPYGWHLVPGHWVG